jgi:hypothetical protein
MKPCCRDFCLFFVYKIETAHVLYEQLWATQDTT